MTNLFLANASPAAPMAADLGSQQSQISVSTALLIIIAFGVLWCAATLLELKRRIESIETDEPDAEPSQPRRAPDDIPAEIVAAISGAIITTYGRGVRIVRMARDDQNTLAWSHEGRRNIFHSHKVR